LAALLTGGAVALPLLAKIDFKKKTPELDEIFCRTGLKYTNEDDRSKYAAKLTQAGIDKPSEWFLGLRLTLVAAFIIVCLPLVILGLDLFWMILFVPLVYIVPGIWLNSAVNKRKNEIRLSLDNFTILLSVALSAGSTDIVALREAAEGTTGPLKREINRALIENDTGKNLNDALYDMAERCDVEELWAIVRVIVQARRHGSPLAEEMRKHSQSIRKHKAVRSDGAGKQVIGKITVPGYVDSDVYNCSFGLPCCRCFAAGTISEGGETLERYYQPYERRKGPGHG
jgi:tight adherence protein C